MLITISLLASILAITGYCLMFQEIVIPAPMFPLISASSLFLLYAVSKWARKKDSTNVNRLVVLTIALFIVMFIGSLAFKFWQWEQMVTREFIMKLTIVLLGLLGVYLNIMYMRAESSYRKKRDINGSPNSRKKDIWNIRKT